MLKYGELRIGAYFQIVNNKGADQTAQMHRLVCDKNNNYSIIIIIMIIIIIIIIK